MDCFRIAFGALGVVVACSLTTHAQGEAAVPFLLLSPSSEANGMGGTTVALQRFDPTSSVFSPAQVGLSSLTTNVRFGLYPATSKTVFATGLPDLEYSAWAASVGVRLNDFIELPLRIGVGLAYHHVVNDLGTFQITNSSGPTPISTFESTESASGFVVGVGLEYILRFGFGYTFRSVESHLSPLGTEQEQGTGEANGSTNDYSFLLEAPLVSIVEEITGEDVNVGSGFQPSLGLSVGMGWNNVGDRIVYVDPAQADPFPRTARAGIAVQGGFSMKDAPGWDLLSAAWSREAEDLLVVPKADGMWEYQSGVGDIQFGTNVIQGKLTGNSGLRSGWQIQVAEVFTVRQGLVKGSASYETSGYTIQLAGVLKGIARVAGEKAPEWLLFARDHIDVLYHHAAVTFQQPQSGDMSSSGLTVLFRVLPW
jgi:hypothetical protein